MTPGFKRNMLYLNKGEQESEIWMSFQKEEKVDIHISGSCSPFWQLWIYRSLKFNTYFQYLHIDRSGYWIVRLVALLTISVCFFFVQMYNENQSKLWILVFNHQKYLLFSSSNFQLSCNASQVLTIKTGDLALYAWFCFATFCVLPQTSVFLRNRKSMSLTLPFVFPFTQSHKTFISVSPPKWWMKNGGHKS